MVNITDLIIINSFLYLCAYFVEMFDGFNLHIKLKSLGY